MSFSTAVRNNPFSGSGVTSPVFNHLPKVSHLPGNGKPSTYYVGQENQPEFLFDETKTSPLASSSLSPEARQLLSGIGVTSLIANPAVKMNLQDEKTAPKDNGNGKNEIPQEWVDAIKKFAKIARTTSLVAGTALALGGTGYAAYSLATTPDFNFMHVDGVKPALFLGEMGASMLVGRYISQRGHNIGCFSGCLDALLGLTILIDLCGGNFLPWAVYLIPYLFTGASFAKSASQEPKAKNLDGAVEELV